MRFAFLRAMVTENADYNLTQMCRLFEVTRQGYHQYVASLGAPRVAKKLDLPSRLSVVMVLQLYSGMSDREAVDAFAFDAWWKYSAGALDYDFPGFVHTRPCKTTTAR